MSNFKGYYIKIDDCTFNDPAIKREGLLIQPHLVQTTDSGVLASGELSIKVLPHTRTKITMQMPIMTPLQYQKYYAIIMQGMYLNLTYYNEGIDQYETGIFYHTDMKYKPIAYNGEDMVDMQEISFTEH